jgi:hypothetical protein
MQSTHLRVLDTFPVWICRKCAAYSFQIEMQLIRFPGAPPSAPIGFSLSQSGMVQEGVHGVAGSNGFRTVMQGQLNERDSFREHVSQVCKAEHRISFRSL